MGDVQWQRDRKVVLDRFVAACSGDDRIVAAFLAGSAARGDADERSDLDLCVVVPDDDFDEVVDDRERLIAQLGDALILEDFGNDGLVFAILTDGTDIELHFVREGELDQVRSGPHRVLVDDRGVLAGMTFPWPEFDRVTQVQELGNVVMWFWHDLSHFAAAIDRGHLWWAAGQLEALRSYCVRLARVEQGAEPMPDEPYWKLDAEMPTAPLDPIRSTFVPMERAALLDAARTLLAFFRSWAPAIARAHGLTYPDALDHLAGARLDDLDAPGTAPYP
ncbi:MAG TPA: aminoglycoside 6-adenylyltransferase [Actinomycetota bacterium]|nr:aminoglycoside 6-adenylyltransferase [Actinomycetota bacterium]